MSYACGTCGDSTIVVFSDGSPPAWHIRCGNGHEWVPTGIQHVLIDTQGSRLVIDAIAGLPGEDVGA